MTASNPVLIAIDVQEGFNDPYWGASTNPQCEANIGRLVSAWREAGLPLVLVRHDSVSPNSPLNPKNPGNALQSVVAGSSDLLISKSVNSAFYGTPNLDEWLKAHDYSHLVICGITTNYCCETTTRMAGNLGYTVDFVLDATRAFDMKDLAGEPISASDVMRSTAANLNEEFANVITTEQALSAL